MSNDLKCLTINLYLHTKTKLNGIFLTFFYIYGKNG